MIQVNARNVPHALVEVMQQMRLSGAHQNSRNGPVISLLEPFYLSIRFPEQRVMFDPVRNANPFFHVMEFVWMMAAQKNVEWLKFFNKRMEEYAEPDGTINGAYGHRWIVGCGGLNQIDYVATLLKKDPDSRQAVIQMWDAVKDTRAGLKDRPCNTHIYFRVVDGRLDMTVCNRSNDVVWGMLGANAVHMTLLHELIANMAELGLGHYRVFTNNAHVYERHFNDVLQTKFQCDPYHDEGISAYPHVLAPGEDYYDFYADARHIVWGRIASVRCDWMVQVALPMYHAWIAYKNDDFITCFSHLEKCKAEDWRRAAKEWVERRFAAGAEQGVGA